MFPPAARMQKQVIKKCFACGAYAKVCYEKIFCLRRVCKNTLYKKSPSGIEEKHVMKHVMKKSFGVPRQAGPR